MALRKRRNSENSVEVECNDYGCSRVCKLRFEERVESLLSLQAKKHAIAVNRLKKAANLKHKTAMAAQKVKFKNKLHALEKEKLRCELQLRRHKDLSLDRADVGEVAKCEGVEYWRQKYEDVKQINHELASSKPPLKDFVEHSESNHCTQQKQPQGPLHQVQDHDKPKEQPSSNSMKTSSGETVNNGGGSESNKAVSLVALSSGPISSFALAPGCANCKALQMQVVHSQQRAEAEEHAKRRL
jgi:hypothetical protein